MAAGQYVLVAVTDTGTGMSAATIEHAFEPFFTTKDVGKGTGLGLSQVYGFVRQSSGHIKIYSEVGEGISIRIYLPRHLDAAEPVRRAGAQSAPPNTPRAQGVECVLVIEDDEDLRMHAIETLGELGYHVLGAADGAAALMVLDEHPQVYLLFTDVVIPGTNGRQLAEAVARKRPGLKVLFTTRYTRNAIVHHGRLDAGIQHITKPYSYHDLAVKVRQTLDE